jgi:hypothetical protein
VITNLPTLNIVTNGFNERSNKECITLIQNPGDPGHFYNREDPLVQVLSRAHTSPIAKKNIEAVYDLLKNRIGLVLPEVTLTIDEEEITYPQITAWRICPMQTPGYVGIDDKNLALWSYNMIVTIKP